MDATTRVSPSRSAAASPPGEAVPFQRQPTRLLDFLLGAMVLFPWAPPGAPEFATVGLAAAAALVFFGSLRRPERPLRGRAGLGWLVPLLLGILAWVAVVSLITPDESLFGWQRREVRLVLVVAYLLTLVAGRVHLPSLIRGMAVGLVANAALFFVGAAPAPYGSFLSGYLLDKNQAGLAYAVVGLLVTGLQDKTSRQALVLAAAAALTWTTGSRTSLAALACGAAWFALRPRLQPFGRVVLALALAGFIRILEADFARVGPFAERDGTDFFRERIDEASRVKLDASPWYGRGLGEAWVPLDSGNFLFHNSYWAALLEGGWVLLATYVLLTGVVAIGLFRRVTRLQPWMAAAEAANVAVLVCSLRLGEVLGATAAMTALAVGIVALIVQRTDPEGEDPASTGPRPGRPERAGNLSR